MTYRKSRDYNALLFDNVIKGGNTKRGTRKSEMRNGNEEIRNGNEEMSL